MKLHLGCGNIKLDGWVNIDTRRSDATDVISRLEEIDKIYGPESVDTIYSCHVLEHFGFGCVKPSVLGMLKMWTSLLKPGGEMYVSVPDLKQIAKGILEAPDLHTEVNFMKCTYGGSEYPENRHFMGFTYGILKDLMLVAGLKDVVVFQPFCMTDTSTFSINNVPISLNLKATK